MPVKVQSAIQELLCWKYKPPIEECTILKKHVKAWDRCAYIQYKTLASPKEIEEDLVQAVNRDSEVAGDERIAEVREVIKAQSSIPDSKEGLKLKKLSDKWHAEMSKDKDATHPPVPWDGAERNRKTTIHVANRDSDKKKYLNLQIAV